MSKTKCFERFSIVFEIGKVELAVDPAVEKWEPNLGFVSAIKRVGGAFCEPMVHTLRRSGEKGEIEETEKTGSDVFAAPFPGIAGNG